MDTNLDKLYDEYGELVNYTVSNGFIITEDCVSELYDENGYIIQLLDHYDVAQRFKYDSNMNNLGADYSDGRWYLERWDVARW